MWTSMRILMRCEKGKPVVRLVHKAKGPLTWMRGSRVAQQNGGAAKLRP